MKSIDKSRKLGLIAAAVVILLALILIIVNKQSASEPSGASSTNSSATNAVSNSSQPSGKEFVFEQLGFTIDEPTGLAGLNYLQTTGASADGQRYLVTSDAFKAAAEACGNDPANSYFASVFKSVANTTPTATIKGQPITVSNGRYTPGCSGSEQESFTYTKSLSDSTKLLKDALQTAR